MAEFRIELPFLFPTKNDLNFSNPVIIVMIFDNVRSFYPSTAGEMKEFCPIEVFTGLDTSIRFFFKVKFGLSDSIN